MRKSLSFKINLTIVIVVTVFVACLGGYDYDNGKKKRIEGLRTELYADVARLKTSLAAPLWNLNKDEIEAIARAEMLNDHIVSIEVYESYSDKIIVEFGRNNFWDVVEGSPSSLDPPVFDASEDHIQKGLDILGRVRVSVTDRFVRAESRDQLGSFLIKIGLLLLFEVLVLITVIQSNVIRPIAQFEAVFSSEDGWAGVDELDVERQDELGQLARSFIAMRDRMDTLFSERDNKISELETARSLLQSSEKNLKESEELFQKMFRNHNAVMLLFDPQSKSLVDANHSACDYYGYTLDHMKTLMLNEISMLPMEDITANLRKVEAGEQQLFELKHSLSSGEIRDVEIHSSAIVVSGKTLLFSIVHDITERKKLMKEHGRSAQLAALGTVAAGVAHEINNPLQGILNYATLIKNAPDNHDRVVDMSQRIVRETERITKITKDLLHYAKDNRTDMLPSNVLDLVESAISLMETKVCREGISISAELAEDMPKMSVYPQGIQQIVINLVDNAYDALRHRKIPKKDKVLRVKVHIVETKEGPNFCLEVYDNGGGMPENVIEKAKEAFFSTKPSSEGTGLGLSIVNEIVSKHDGQMEIESQEGDYTNIKVLLPIKPMAV